MRNMGGPFTINIISEITLISTLWSSNFLSRLPVLLTAFIAVVYCLLLYSLVIHGQLIKKALTHRKSTINELLVGALHSFYGIILCLATPVLYYFYTNLYIFPSSPNQGISGYLGSNASP